MVKSVTVDSSVIISSLLPNEKRHEEACKIWGKVLSGETPAVMPYSVLVEVVASIRRRTGSELLAVEVQKTLENITALSFVMLDSRAAAKVENKQRTLDCSLMRGVSPFFGINVGGIYGNCKCETSKIR